MNIKKWILRILLIITATCAGLLVLTAPAISKGKPTRKLEIKLERTGKNNLVKVTVQNNLKYPIGWMTFTVDTLQESGELSFESLGKGESLSKNIVFRTMKQVKIRDLRVVDEEAITRKPKVLVRIRR